MAENIIPFPLPHQGDPDPRRMALASIGFHWQDRDVAPRPCGPLRCRHRCHGRQSVGAAPAALDEATASTPAVSSLVGFPSAAGTWKVASTSCGIVKLTGER